MFSLLRGEALLGVLNTFSMLISEPEEVREKESMLEILPTQIDFLRQE